MSSSSRTKRTHLDQKQDGSEQEQRVPERVAPPPRTFDPLGLLSRDDGDVGAGEKQGERQGQRPRAPRPH